MAAMCTGSSAPSSISAVSLVISAGPAMAMRKASVRYIRLTPRLDLRPVAYVRANGVSLALVIVIVANFSFGSTDGLAQRVFEVQQLFNMADTYAAIFAAG